MCRYHFLYLIFVWVLYGSPYTSFGQDRPPINVYLPSDYGGEPQNWAISQSKDQNIYVANNRGLLEFNGNKWEFNKSPNETIIRSVKVIDDLIYTGSHHDFGYWKRDKYGGLNYTSLSDSLNVSFSEDEEFWNIMSLENTVLFQSLHRIHIYNSEANSYNIVDSNSTISRLFKVGDSFYFQNLNDGLYKIENGISHLISDDIVIKNNVIVNVYKHEKGLLILTQDNGFFTLVNDALKPWIIPPIERISQISVFSSTRLHDGSFVLGTISDGVIILSSEGELLDHINQGNGLSNNTVLSVFEDYDNNIWLGLDNGINSLNIKSPFRIFNDKNGIIGSVYASKIFDNMVYLGTNQGLFYKPIDAKTGYQFIEGTQGQVWCLEEIDNTLFCGHNSGTFIINKKKAEKIADVQGTWQIKPIKHKDNLILQGNYYGLNVLEKINGIWELRNKLEGFDISSRFFEIVNPNEIFVNHEYKGLFRLEINDSLSRVENFEVDSTVEKGLYSSLLKHNDDILYANRKGVFKYDTAAKLFSIDSLLTNLIVDKEFTSAKLVSDSNTNKLWSFSSYGLKYYSPDKLSNQGKINNINFHSDFRKDVIGYENITHISAQRYLLGTSIGYVILDLEEIRETEQNVNINHIEMSKFKEGDIKHLVELSGAREFSSNENNFEFSYGIPSYLKTQKTEFRYKLEGMYDVWSDWSSNASINFENLPYGDYTFIVNGRVGDSDSLSNASFSFKINRPWLLSNTALILYLITLILLSALIHNIYKRYYRKQRERLVQSTSRELEVKELENKQQLMRFNNHKLRQDIDNKNRELGISTMSLIKKNEFLNSIKKELQSVESGTNLKHIIKIIDRNLNDKDDWHLFEEAFNNADKDFLKKVKSLHPELTSNDLRLCAYLRLNLSSKEIAPLLNISSRSVEVKRYRLRKKMNLPHESNLTDYILEI